MQNKTVREHPFRILLADDEVSFGDTLDDIFGESTAKLVRVHDGKRLLAAIKQEVPDLILLDIHFPNIDGLELLEKIKSDQETWHIPVIMMTADSQKSLIDKAMHLGAVDYLVKPFRIHYFQEKINQFFGVNLFDILLSSPVRAPVSQQIEQPKGAILLIDDNESIQYLVRDIIHELGYSVDSCYDGVQGLQLAMENPYSLILLNINMPNLNGYAVLKALRNYPTTENTPVIMMSGESERESIQAARQLGISGYVMKPFLLQTLIAQIQQAMHIHKSFD